MEKPLKSESYSVVSDSLQPHGQYSPWNCPGQNTGVGNLSLLQWIVLTQELNWGLLYCRLSLYQPSYQGSPYLYLLYIFLIFNIYKLHYFCHSSLAQR